MTHVAQISPRSSGLMHTDYLIFHLADINLCKLTSFLNNTPNSVLNVDLATSGVHLYASAHLV